MDITVPASAYGGGLVFPYLEHQPQLGENVFIAPNASVIGETTLGDEVSIWFGAVLRGDIAPVSVGRGSNIQDNAVLHVGDDEPCFVGENVVVGHQALLHGCTVEDDCLIGMGAIVLNRAVIGRGSLVGAGALVTQGTIIPPNSLVVGSPATVKRELKDDERQQQAVYAAKYVEVAHNYRLNFST
ncbi:MAG: gamma carbonic anhydrase family protein [Candidatus Hinthialibacter antarcticus]|nr:gamma carbonic anhydrase family protein [Candidatus Hinthialibacter antarcticus]